ncbi:putative membrane protein [Bordetella holmesii 30539]|nr:putative membrane protein [Bordetella holmesii ATCC 51541]AIT26473.1 putative membrane protein [Bordetella holmesii 44057]EWM47047.1 putative membrane protein [Bordetella holmesii 35009]EWM51215.1 putative membrane protein [Bordetella holmesii 70147]EXF90070.1 putative membrane protein [Bordetella holmesii 30539]
MNIAPKHMPTVLTTIRTVLAAMPFPAMGAGTFSIFFY